MASISTANTCLELHIGNGMYCREPFMHNYKPSTQSCLSKIKPHMLRRVMSMNESCCWDIHHQAGKATELSCNMKMMDLFPRQKGFVDSSIPAEAKANPLCEEDDMVVNESVDVTHLRPPGEESKSQLTILYNGAIKVFDVSAEKAEIIMMIAAGNSLQQTYAFDGASSSVQNQKSDAELPIAKKLSLQRFLQKRMDRSLQNSEDTGAVPNIR